MSRPHDSRRTREEEKGCKEEEVESQKTYIFTTDLHRIEGHVTCESNNKRDGATLVIGAAMICSSIHKSDDILVTWENNENSYLTQGDVPSS